MSQSTLLERTIKKKGLRIEYAKGLRNYTLIFFEGEQLPLAWARPLHCVVDLYPDLLRISKSVLVNPELCTRINNTAWQTQRGELFKYSRRVFKLEQS